MIGFIEQSIAIKKNHPFINVTLEEDIAQLDEVVVVGYGTKRKGSIAAAVTTIGTEDIARTTSSTVSGALVGKIAGITTRQKIGAVSMKPDQKYGYSSLCDRWYYKR